MVVSYPFKFKSYESGNPTPYLHQQLCKWGNKAPDWSDHDISAGEVETFPTLSHVLLATYPVSISSIHMFASHPAYSTSPVSNQPTEEEQRMENVKMEDNRSPKCPPALSADENDDMSFTEEEVKAVPPQYLERCSSPESPDILVGAYLLDHMRTHCEQCGVSDTPQWYDSNLKYRTFVHLYR